MRRSTVRQLSAAALADSSALLERIEDALVAVEPSGFYDGPSRDDLREATRSGFEALLTCLAGELPLEEAAQTAREAGRRQVQQDLPLEGVLRAYRVAGREIWDDFVASAHRTKGRAPVELLDSASDLWTVIDAFSAAAGEGFRAEEGLLRKRDDRVQESILAALLDGRAAEPVFARDAARALGLAVDERMVCLVGLAGQAGAVAFDAPKERLRAEQIQSVWVSTAEGECGLVLLGRSKTSALRSWLAPAVRGRAGMSPPFEALDDLPRMRRLAEIAGRCSPVPGRVAVLDDDLPAALASDSPLVADVVWQRTVGSLITQSGTDSGMLLDTVRSFLAAGASLNAAATEAFVHRNTMLYRLKKVEQLTGVPLRELNGQLLWVIGLEQQRLRDRH